ncbi:MAG: tetratricopeptide repeat protein [Phycisphaeraceae bacterium]
MMDWRPRMLFPPALRRRPLALALAVGLALAAGAGCQAPPAGDDDAAPAVRFEPGELDPPPGVDRRAVAALAGDALEQARLELEAVVANIATPPELRVGKPSPGMGDPPPVALRAYAAGRIAWHEDQPHRAINHLNRALAHAPGRPEILSLLGRLHTATGNRVRGAMYLSQALEANPDDLDSLMLLGAYALEQEEWERAIALLARARSKVAGDPRAAGGAFAPAVHHHLAIALTNAGYARAAIAEHRASLRGVDIGLGGAGAILANLTRQRGSVQQMIGDLHHRLGNPRAALEAYQAAADDAGDDPTLAARLLYTHLVLGELAPAQAIVVDRMQARGDTGLALARYLRDQGVPVDDLAATLEQIYQHQPDSHELARTIGELLPAPRGRTLLTNHVRAHPDAVDVYTSLLREHLLAEDDAGADGEALPRRDGLAAAVSLTAALLERADTDAGVELVMRLMELAGPAGRLLEAADDVAGGGAGEMAGGTGEGRVDAAAKPGDGGADAVADGAGGAGGAGVRLLRGLLLVELGRVDEAERMLTRAVELAPALESARVHLARVLLARQHHARAAEVLEPVADSDSPRVLELRVRVLARTGRVDEAMDLLDRIIARGGADTEVILQKAMLQYESGDAPAAEATLLDAMNVRPRDEALYEALFDLYARDDATRRQLGDLNQRWPRLVRRVLTSIPDTRIGRLTWARQMEAQGRREQAVGVLEQLLEDDPRDHQALDLLLDVYVRLQREDEARDRLARELEQRPRDRRLLEIAAQFFRARRDGAGEVEILQRVAVVQPASAAELAARMLQLEHPHEALATITRALDRPGLQDPRQLASLLWPAARGAADEDDLAGAVDDVIDRLAALGERFPDHAPTLAYERGMTAYTAGQRERSLTIMEQAVEQFPDDPDLNNALGYTWLEEGRNLERAERMIRRAVDAQPANAAYLDSLGWVHYKQGRFREATVWLRRAGAAPGGEDPVIVDHLGDALYRAGDAAGAARAWRQVQGMLDRAGSGMLRNDPELEGLADRVEAKLEALADDEQVPVAAAATDTTDTDEDAEPDPANPVEVEVEEEEEG